MINFIKKKYFRFFESKNVLKINFIIHKYFKEKAIGTLDLDFNDKPSRVKIVQSIIDEKNYKNYLEIGCWKNDLFNEIQCENKIGVDPVSGGIILLHDWLPINVYAQAIPRCQYTWNGDVWKAITEFRTHKDLDIYTCYADQGIGVILNRKNRNFL